MSQVAGIVLAAGTSSRFGAANKLLAPWKGQPMLRTVVEAALATELDPVIVVTGHEAKSIADVLDGLDIRSIHNLRFESGQASSVQTGIAVLPADCDGIMVLLGDMPRVSPREINALIDAFENDDSIVVPRFEGQRGNPVIFGRAHFAELTRLTGDKGARELLSGSGVTFVDMETDAVLKDVDTPEALL